MLTFSAAYLQKYLAILSVLSICSMYFGIALMDFGIGMLLRSIKNDKIKNKILKKLKPIWMLNQIYLLVLFLLLFIIFQSTLEAFFSIFPSIIILLICVFILRKTAIKFTARSSNTIVIRFSNFLIADTSFMILVIFSAITSCMLQGIPFYYDNSGKIISLFKIAHLFNITTAIIIIIFLSFSISLGSLFCSLYIKSLRKFTIACSGILLAILIALLPSLIHINYPWCNTRLHIKWLHFIPIILQNLALFNIIIKRTKFAMVFTILGIVSLMALFVSMMYPYVLPSCVDLKQSINIDSDYNFINSFIPTIIALTLGAVFLIFLHRIIAQKTIRVEKEFLRFLIAIVCTLTFIYFLNLDSILTLSNFLDQMDQ